MLLGSMSMQAAYRSVIVQRHDGTSLQIALQDDLRANIGDGNVVFSCDKGTVTLPSSEVWKWNFSQNAAEGDIEWSGIDETAAMPLLVNEAGRLSLLNLAPGEAVTLVSLAGITIAAGNAGSAGNFEIDTDGTAPGFYILSYGKHSVKILLNR